MKNRIALIGNMNNNFFSLVRYLRDAGYDAHLFYSVSNEHFQPKTDTFSLDYSSYCHECNWATELFTEKNIVSINATLDGFDFFIGQGLEAALASYAGYTMDVYYPYGSDFYKFAYHKEKHILLIRLRKKLKLGIPFSHSKKEYKTNYYKHAITEAKNVYIDYTNDEYQKKLTDLGLKGNFKNMPFPIIYYPEYVNRTVWDTHWKSIVDKVRQNNDFIILYHGRQEWKNSSHFKGSNFSNKNTHHVILGFAELIKKNPELKVSLIMLEYGGDVQNSKELILELGIGLNVLWLPKMYRKDIMYVISQSDICCGEFDKSYITFGTIIEAMLMGKPVLHYRLDDLYKHAYSELYPLYNCRMPDEIYNQMQKALDNPEERIEVGKKAQNWVKEHLIKKSIQKLINTIDSGS
jgi:glycosyltransferase involved in cell wall biosynthesis